VGSDITCRVVREGGSVISAVIIECRGGISGSTVDIKRRKYSTDNNELT